MKGVWNKVIVNSHKHRLQAISVEYSAVIGSRYNPDATEKIIVVVTMLQIRDRADTIRDNRALAATGDLAKQR